MRLSLPVLKIPRASPLEVNFLRIWLENKDKGAGFLKGMEALTWHEAHGDDFITLNPDPGSAETDSFTKALNSLLLSWYNALIGRHSKVRMCHKAP